ncbi:MAG: ABC transporter permease subunit [Deltaproteobacteria bacterium]|nr:ABC transporter permease subunit [Deltaproteobacteria bacterium]
MRQFPHILKKEFADYFVSPIAYIVIAIFLIVTGWFFFSTFFLYNQASMRNFFTLLPIIFSFVIPAVCMRLFSEETHQGSYELLMTLPVTHADVVIGKFSAAVVFCCAMLIPTLAYPASISFLGSMDWGPVIGGYIGAILLAGAFSAISLFASSLTDNQIIAFIIGAAVCITLTLINQMLFFVPSVVLSVISYIGTGVHFENISKGIIDSRDIVYFASVIFIFLYGTYISLLYKE